MKNRLALMIAAAPLSSYYAMMANPEGPESAEFVQPVLDPGNPAPGDVAFVKETGGDPVRVPVAEVPTKEVVEQSATVVAPSSVRTVEKVQVVDATVADNATGTDELSLAIAADDNRNAVYMAEPKALPGKYQLSYTLDGKDHVETHSTLDHAVARVRALKVMNIHPKTATLY